jgi:hypothetical protein
VNPHDVHESFVAMWLHLVRVGGGGAMCHPRRARATLLWSGGSRSGRWYMFRVKGGCWVTVEVAAGMCLK